MLKKIVSIVEQAGELIRCAHDVEQDTTEKSNPSDLVTKYDVAVQNFLHTRLMQLMPEADFLGEEGEHEELTAPWVWVVDPIDGTANFVQDMGYSNISVALVHDGAVEYGVVYNPFRGEMFAAQRGKGATMNGKPIHASQYDAAHGLLLCGSTLYDRDLSDRHFAMMRALYDRCADYRRFAAAALDLCHIACGRAEIYFECRLRPWDFAAGSLVLTEAGGCVVQMDGSPLDILGNSSIFATNQPCRDLLDVIRDL